MADDFAGAVNPFAPSSTDPPTEETPQQEPTISEETQPEAEDTPLITDTTPTEAATPTTEPEAEPKPKPAPRKPPARPSPPPPNQQPKTQEKKTPPPRPSPPPQQTKTTPPQQPKTTPPQQPRAAPPRQSQATSQAAKPPPPDGPQDKKAREFIEQAEKKLKSSQSFFGGLFGGAAKKEEAADLFVRAANAYKVGKRYKAAGEAFRRAAEIHMELDVKHEAATTLVEAGQVLKKADPREATECYLRAVEIYTDMGRFSLAARYHNTIAEIFETEVQDFEEAIAHYEQAADFYRGEDSTASSNKALLKVAHMSATLQNYKKAADLFEDIGRSSLGNNLLKYAAKDYFFKASLCHFCLSPGNARDAIIRYRQLHPGFEGSRELKLLQDLLACGEEEDTDKFADIVKDYDAISRLDNWTTTMLLTIKKNIGATPDVN